MLGIVLLVFAIGVSSSALPRGLGAGEVYALWPSSNRAQESNTPGMTLFLQVTNPMAGTGYAFTFTVTDPAGTGRNALNSTTATSSSFLLSVVYPRDFPPGTTIRYVGNYTINVRQTQPIVIPSVATGRFEVGLTDSESYQRTRQISMKAIAYAANENVSTSLVHAGVPISGFPVWQLANSAGDLDFSWTIPPSTVLGMAVLSLTGSTTTKTIPDTQSLRVNSTSVNIQGLTVNTPAVRRIETEQFLFAPHYPDGQRVQTGQATIRIVESDGVTNINTTGTYDITTGNFRTTYVVPKDALVGIWIATIDPNRFDDGYGNQGPTQAVSAGFSVSTAALNVTILADPSPRTLRAGDAIPIFAIISYTDGSTFNTGTVTAKFLHGGILIGTPITLYYASAQREWTGSYTVTNSDPSGIWLLTVGASDQFTNTGEETYAAPITIIPMAQPSTGFETSVFLLVTAIAAASALPVLLYAILVKRKKIARKQLKLDLSIVDKEVDRVQSSDFFKNVKKQVEEEKPEQNTESTSKTGG